MKREITAEDLQRFEGKFDADKVNRVAMNAAAQAGVNGAARNYAVQQNNPYAFSIEVDAGKVCDQKQSGRCWMFAALNVMRQIPLLPRLQPPATFCLVLWPFPDYPPSMQRTAVGLR